MSEARFRLREGEHRRELAIDEQSAQEENARFRICPHAKELLVFRGFGSEIGELLAGDQYPPDCRGEMIDGDLDLRRTHTLMRRYQSLRQQVALRVVDEEHRVSIAVVLDHILGERVQRLRYVSGGGQDS